MPEQAANATGSEIALPSSFLDVIGTITPAGDVASRISANLAMAQSFLAATQPGRALGFLERAWLLGARDIGTLRPLIKGLIADGRAHSALDRVREAGWAAIERDDPHDLTRCLIHYCETAFLNKFPLQDDILARASLTYLGKFQPDRPVPSRVDKIRVGYVFWLEDNPKTIISQIAIGIARYHDKERFDVTFFSFSSRDEILSANLGFASWLDQIAALGHRFVDNPPGGTSFERTERLAQAIRTQEIDVLVMLTQWGVHFALACLRPAPVVLGHNCGTPDIDSSIALDHYVVATGQAMAEARCNAIRSRAAYPGATEAPPVPLSRSDFGIEPASVLIASSGSNEKFADPRYWDFLDRLVEARPQIELLFIGPTEEAMQTIGGPLSERLRTRSRPIGFRRDFREALAMADIYLDTYPIGGGHAVLEAITQGIPCILRRPDPFRLASFHHNYRGISELGADPEFALDDLGAQVWLARVVELIDEPAERQRLAAIQARALHEERSDNPTYTAELERLMVRLVRQ